MTRPAHGFSLIVVLGLLLALSALASTGVAPLLLEQQVLQRERDQLQAEQAALAALDTARISLTTALQQQQAFIDLARQIKTAGSSARQHNTADVLCAYHPPI